MVVAAFGHIEGVVSGGGGVRRCVGVVQVVDGVSRWRRSAGHMSHMMKSWVHQGATMFEPQVRVQKETEPAP